MTQPVLLVFIDSLPYRIVEDLGLLQWLLARYPVAPGAGYSYTQKAEILQGRLPDDMGFLNFWQHIGPNTVPLRRWHRAAEMLRDLAPFWDKVLHYAVAKIRRGTANIPFELVGSFRPGAENPYEGIAGSVLEGSWHRLIGEDAEPDLDDRRTLAALDALITSSPPARVFISLPELDKIGHIAGPSAPAYAQHARLLDTRLAAAAQRFRAHFPDAIVLVFSDHGMLDVERTLHLPGRLFTVPGNRRAAYWLDSTMLRVWTDTAEEADLIRGRLEAVSDLQILTTTERRAFGVASDEFGAIIAFTKPGVVFRPNHFGIRTPKGMHGYHPDEAQHYAVLACGPDRPAARPHPGPLRTEDVYRMLSHWARPADPAVDPPGPSRRA